MQQVQRQEDTVTKHPVGDGEIDITTELVGHNVAENSSTVNYSFRVTKPITVAVFTLGTETGEN